MKILSLTLMLTILCSCSPELPDGEKLIRDLYEVRVADFVSQKTKDCKAKALAAAEEHVDSIVYRMLNADLVDSLEFPQRPLKPVRPSPIIGKVTKFDIEE